jgi:hypothetical protein
MAASATERPMPNLPADHPVSIADLDDWVSRGLIRPDQRDAIVSHLAAAPAPPPEMPRERPAGFNMVTVAYYFGAFLILLAWTIFLGLQWEELGHAGQTLVSLLTVAALWLIGAFLRRRDYPTAGNLLIFAGAGVAPLVVYSALNWAGWWPEDRRADAYEEFYQNIHGNWVVLEIASIGIALAVIRWIRFPLLALLVAFWTWYLSMDIARLLTGRDDRGWGELEWVVGALFGAAMLALGLWLQRDRGDQAWSRWFYLFGHLALLGNLGILALDRGGSAGILFLLVYLGIAVASVVLQSRMWLVFGALGVYAYVSRLAFEVFAGSLGFVAALAVIGVLIVLSTVAFQRFIHPWLRSSMTARGNT